MGRIVARVTPPVSAIYINTILYTYWHHDAMTSINSEHIRPATELSTIHSTAHCVAYNNNSIPAHACDCRIVVDPTATAGSLRCTHERMRTGSCGMIEIAARSRAMATCPSSTPSSRMRLRSPTVGEAYLSCVNLGYLSFIDLGRFYFLYRWRRREARRAGGDCTPGRVKSTAPECEICSRIAVEP
jgi:hypothetical protein